jgi:hypothetical protein
VIQVLRAAGTYSQLKRNLPADDPRVIDAHRDLVAERLLAHISEILANSPPLTGEQVERIAAVLAGGRQ